MNMNMTINQASVSRTRLEIRLLKPSKDDEDVDENDERQSRQQTLDMNPVASGKWQA